MNKKSISEKVEVILSTGGKSHVSNLLKLLKLPNDLSEVIGAVANFNTSDLSSYDSSKYHRIVVDFLVELGATIKTDEELREALKALTDYSRNAGSIYNNTFSWFATGVIRNKNLSIDSFISITDPNLAPPALTHLREGFWDMHQGGILRLSYYNNWLESTDDGRQAAEMPEGYAYNIWYNLVIPDEIKSWMPNGYRDPLLIK